MKRFRVSKNKSGKCLRCWFIPLASLAVALGVRFAVSSRLVSLGGSICQFESQKQSLLKENEQLSNQSVALGSYTRITKIAHDSFGFSYDLDSLSYLTSPKIASR